MTAAPRAHAPRRLSVNGSEPKADERLRRLAFESASGRSRLTHQMFRFPAKFHPPIARQLILDHTSEGDVVCDPFCGSGTLLVEAAVTGRSAVGVDVDPLSVFLSRVKSSKVDMDALRSAAEVLTDALRPLKRPPAEYRQRVHDDLDETEYREQLVGHAAPAIPNLLHWFRRYVIIDLLRIKRAIQELPVDGQTRDVLRLVFASTLRGASNADPVPVSGLERTSHMRARDKAGRLVDPFALYEKKLRQTLLDVQQFQEQRSPDAECLSYEADASDALPAAPAKFDAVITSPPYHGAVDYYRRHQLEMFWLDMTASQNERLALLDRYIGRPTVPQRHRYVLDADLSSFPRTEAAEALIRATAPKRADSFVHYCIGMRRTLGNLARKLPTGAPAVLVVGHSTWNQTSLDTSGLFEELAAEWFMLSDHRWYPVRNRHMSYARHNGANIDREYVLVLRRT
jgi:16S rRNA G966 N2-methylase RsmD